MEEGKYPPFKRIPVGQDGVWSVRTLRVPGHKDGAWWAIEREGRRFPGVRRGPKGGRYAVWKYQNPIDAMRAIGELKEEAARGEHAGR